MLMACRNWIASPMLFMMSDASKRKRSNVFQQRLHINQFCFFPQLRKKTTFWWHLGLLHLYCVNRWLKSKFFGLVTSGKNTPGPISCQTQQQYCDGLGLLCCNGTRTFCDPTNSKVQGAIKDTFTWCRVSLDMKQHFFYMSLVSIAPGSANVWERIPAWNLLITHGMSLHCRWLNWHACYSIPSCFVLNAKMKLILWVVGVFLQLPSKHGQTLDLTGMFSYWCFAIKNYPSPFPSPLSNTKIETEINQVCQTATTQRSSGWTVPTQI